jgi:hypothetical protein
LATSNEEGKTYIGSSLEPCAPPNRTPNDGCARMRPEPTKWREAAAIIRGACLCAPWPCAASVATRAPIGIRAPRCQACPCGCTRSLLPFAPPLPCAPYMRTPPPYRAHPACAPLFAVHASCVCLSHPCAPLPCAPPEYKFHKLVVHSATWASEPLTTKMWLTTGCLSGDYSFYIHCHSHAQGCACMHVIFHVFLFIFIINACQLGGHIKLLASLDTFQCYVLVRGRQGCHKGRNWRKITVRTSFSSGRPRAHVYPADAVLPADKFLPSADAVKTASARTQPSVRADAKKI